MEQIPVLDKGFVRLVDFMGGDEAVIQAARVSHGAGAKGGEKDKKLVAYLLKHEHMSPFEHSFFKFHISLPVFVMRQWIRHRMACVTGKTRLYFDLPSGPKKGKYRSYRMSVEEFHRKWHEGAEPIPLGKKPSMRIRIPQRDRLQRMLLRNLDEVKWSLGHTRVVDIFKTGEKPVFEVTLEDGKTIQCTKDHRFLWEDGWKTLEAATGLTHTGGVAACRDLSPRLAANGRLVASPLYRDKEWLETQYRMPEASDATIAASLGVSAIVIRKWRRIHGLTHIKPHGFPPGMAPWNKGLRYQIGDGHRELTPEHKESIRKACSGPNSNFWKGGVSTPRADIARWTTQAAPRVFARDAYRCRSCGTVGGTLEAHHLIPVWTDRSRAMDESNLAALCKRCHRETHRTDSELALAEKILGAAPVAPYRPVAKPKVPIRYLVPKWVGIASIRYLGVQPTFDLSVEGPHHNYVAEGIITHNSYNEISARYTEVKDEFYVPKEWRAPDPVNKQASRSSPALDQKRLTKLVEEAYRGAYGCYQALLEAGVAREMARMVLPTSMYTQFYWTVNARSLMHFVCLRADAGAQWEIQRYAEALAGVFAEKMPWTWAAFLEHMWKGENPTLRKEKERLCGSV